MRSSLGIIVIMFTILMLCVTLPNDAEEPGGWEVKWYRVRPTTDGGEFRVFLESEMWNQTSFYFNWGGHIIYDKLTDNVVFIATTAIHSDGGKYRLKLYDVDDRAIVTIDGEEVLSAVVEDDIPGSQEKDITIAKGQHLLRVEYREECCKASIGFSLPDSLYVANNDDNGIPGIGILLLLSALMTVVVILRIFDRR